MALEALAPDQRAVVQLVLQQGRSYADLAGLLGISEDAVRQRARAGLSALGAGTALGDDEQGRVADYLLGQQPEGEGAAIRDLLASSEPARTWAQAVAEELRPVARKGLPEIPAASGAAAVAAPAPAPQPVAAPAPEPEPEPEPEPAPEPAAASADAEETAAEPTPSRRRERVRREPAEDEAPARPRQRPRREKSAKPARARRERKPADDEPKAARGPKTPKVPAERSSRVGGAFLIAGLGVLLAVAVIWMLTRGDNDGANTAQNNATTSQPAQTTPQAQPIAQLPLRAAGGSKAEGLVQLNATPEGQVTFTLAARNVPPAREGQAYAVWLIGKGQPAQRLGFASALGEDGTLATSGPQPADQARFVGWLQEYSQMVVSRETTDQSKDPAEVILRASLAQIGENGGGQGGGGAAPPATPTPTPAP